MPRESSIAGSEGEKGEAGGDHVDSAGMLDCTGQLMTVEDIDFDMVCRLCQLFMNYVLPAMSLMLGNETGRLMCWQLMTVALVESKRHLMWSLVQALAKQSTTLCIDGWSIVQLVVQHIGWSECWLAWWSTMIVMVVCLSHLGRYRGNTATRVERKRRTRCRKHGFLQLRALMLLSLLQSGPAMQGEGNPVVAQQLMEQMASLAMAPTRVATAAENALTATSRSGGGSAASGLQAASRVLKNPDTFDGNDPHAFMSWKFVFTSWLNFG